MPRQVGLEMQFAAEIVGHNDELSIVLHITTAGTASSHTFTLTLQEARSLLDELRAATEEAEEEDEPR